MIRYPPKHQSPGQKEIVREKVGWFVHPWREEIQKALVFSQIRGQNPRALCLQESHDNKVVNVAEELEVG